MTAVEEPGPAGSRAALADALRKAMNAAGMRQADLAKESGLAPATVSYTLNRKGRVPTVDTLNLLAQALHISGEPLERLHQLREHSDARRRRLDHYLSAAARAAAEHPYPGILPGTQPALASVYLGQRVTRVLKPSTNTEEANAHTEEAEGPATVPAEQVLATNPCIVLAGPGGGKSSLLRSRLAHGVARWQTGRGEATLPVLISAASLLDRPLPQALAEAVTAHLASYGLAEALSADFFAAAPVKDTRWLVLVDSLDEVTDATERARIVRGLAAVQSDHANLYTIVIASRPLPVDELSPMGSQIPCYELLPFDEEQTEDVALRWMQALNLPDPEDATSRFTQALQASRLAALARVPLMLSMLCHLWANNPGIPLPANRTQIYADFTALLNERAVNPAFQPRSVQAPLLPYGTQARTAAERTLDHLSMLIDRFAASRQNGSTQTALDILLAEPAAACPTRVPAATWSAFLCSSLRSSGLLTEHAGDFTFLHQTLQEFCAARHTVRTPQDLTRALEQLFTPLPWSRKSNRLRGVFNPMVPWRLRRARSMPDRELASFAGFVLDAALQCAPRIALMYLHQTATGRAGIPGVQFLAEQRHLGTTIPHEILRAAADTCVTYAYNRKVPDHWRVRAARALWRLEDARAWDVYTTVALDPGIGPDARREAALDLVTHSPLSETERAKALAAPSRLNEGVNVLSFRHPTQIHDERSADFFAALATNESIDPDFRMRAARVLLTYGDARGADLCAELTQPHHAITPFHGIVAKEMLKRSDARGADILIRIVRSNSESRWSRALALVDLIHFQPQAASGLCEEVTNDQATPAELRVDAAELLFLLDVEQCRAACYSLLQSPVTPPEQLRLGRRLAFLGDARGVELCAAFAADAGTDEDVRSQATNALREIAYPEEAGLSTTIATALAPALRRRAVQALTGVEDDRAD
jgi:transcriptional regulator with XRE-family HTH domain